MLKKYVFIGSTVIMMVGMATRINTEQFKGLDPALDAQVEVIDNELALEKLTFYEENADTELAPYSDFIWSKAMEVVNEHLQHQFDRIAYSIYTDEHPNL